MKPIRYHANQELVTRVQQATGLTKRESQVAVIATTAAIIDQLLEGREVAISNLGVFYFRMAPGRMTLKRRSPGGRIFTCAALKVRPVLKFKVSKLLRDHLVGVEPEEVYPMHKPLRSTPSPSPSPGDSGSPSSPSSEGGAVLI